MKATPWVLLGLLLATSHSALAQTPADEEKAIRGVVAAFADAFAKGDAKAIAALFTGQGEAIDLSGESIRGRDALEAHYAERFQSFPGEKIEPMIELIHFLSPEVARQDGKTRLIPTGGGAPSTSRYTATLARTRGQWLIASIRELEEKITHHERLKELEWMVGDWIEETVDTTITNTFAWSEDGNFLLRSYDIRVAGQPEIKGTQRIGWDPLTSQVKSWVFDSKGGYGDGFWTRNEDRWIIKATGVRADGLTTSATQTLTRVGKDRINWRSTDRTLGGETRDDHHDVMMVRRPPPPQPK